MIGRTVSHYKILGPLGAGGMGVVYLAEDTRLGRQVALKFLPATWSQDTKALDRFRVEARAASSLSHPSICAIFDIGQDGDTPFIVMEALKGTTLRDRILKGPLKVAEVLEIGMQLADALDAAHAQGIVHRDIKPANIFLGERNRVKVLDFGLAKLTGPTSAPSGETDTTSPSERVKSNQMTQPGTALGTVSYMSPEQARGEPVDSRTDLFSLGAVLYEMVTGVQAFGGSTTAVVYDAILNRQPRPIAPLNPLVPGRLETVIATALEKDRDLRYQHASDLQAELKRVRRDLDAQSLAGSETVVLPSRPSAPTAPVTAAVPSKARANWPARVAILLAVLASAVAALLFFRGQPPGEPVAAPASDAPAISSAQPADAAVSPPPPAATTPAPISERQAASPAPAPSAPQLKPRVAAPSETPPDSRASLPSPAVTPPAVTPAVTPPAVTPPKPVQPGVEAAPSPPPTATPSPTSPPPVAPAAPEEAKPQPPRTAAPAEEKAAPPVPVPVQPAPQPRPAAPQSAPPAASQVETDDAAIRRVIRVYERAIETKDIALYRSVRTNLTRAAETVLMNSFSQIDSQEIDIRIESLRIDGRTASARLVRRDTLVTDGRREVRNSTQTMRFEKADAGWLIAE